MKHQRIYLCEDTFEGILTAVYEAYISRYGHKYQSIEAGDYTEGCLFAETIPVLTDMDKAKKVADAIIKKISYEAFRMVRYSAMSAQPNKADAVYRFLILGFSLGSKVTGYLSHPYVNPIMHLHREVSYETQRLYGFVRFRELNNGVLFAKLAPKHHQLPLLAPHFSDRYPEENWIIYDERRGEACIHQKRSDWEIVPHVSADLSKIETVSEEQELFESLWKKFYSTLGIKERRNERCRMNLMPKMYWSNLTEMQQKEAHD